jgi:hypothetical protein
MCSCCRSHGCLCRARRCGTCCARWCGSPLLLVRGAHQMWRRCVRKEKCRRLRPLHNFKCDLPAAVRSSLRAPSQSAASLKPDRTSRKQNGPLQARSLHSHPALMHRMPRLSVRAAMHPQQPHICHATSQWPGPTGHNRSHRSRLSKGKQAACRIQLAACLVCSARGLHLPNTYKRRDPRLEKPPRNCEAWHSANTALPQLAT